MSEFLDRLRDEHPRRLAAGVALLAVVAGLAWYRAGLSSGGAEVVAAALPAAEKAPPPVTTTTAGVVVHVAGAVARPGLYHLPAGSRVADAIQAAGGPRARADLDRLNLAARLTDGVRVAVARHGEPDLPGPVGPPGAGGGVASAAGTPAAGPVDLNTASAAELDALPGVGPATAGRILEERQRRGGFRSVRDLLRIPGIGERRFAELKDRVRV